jgi:hypothetical protein
MPGLGWLVGSVLFLAILILLPSAVRCVCAAPAARGEPSRWKEGCRKGRCGPHLASRVCTRKATATRVPRCPRSGCASGTHQHATSPAPNPNTRPMCAPPLARTFRTATITRTRRQRLLDAVNLHRCRARAAAAYSSFNAERTRRLHRPARPRRHARPLSPTTLRSSPSRRARRTHRPSQTRRTRRRLRRARRWRRRQRLSRLARHHF